MTEPKAFFAAEPDAWLAAIVDSSDDAIIGKTLDSVIRSWNAGATRIFGYEPAEIIGRSVLTLMPPERQHEETEIVSRLSRGERIDHFETVRMRRDGSRIEVSISVSPIRDGEGRIVGAAKVARDITEQKRLLRVERELAEQLQETAAELEQQVEEGQSLQEELEQTNEQLARSLTEAEEARKQAEEANVAKSQFLATMSHELRTPLNAIAGYVELLAMGLRGPITREMVDDLSRIKRNQASLLHLIDDVLSFAKLESGKLQYEFTDVRLAEFLGTLETFVAPRVAQKRLKYVLVAGPDVTISIDRSKVEQILLNFLSNAVKFTHAGEIRVSWHVGDDQVRIDVRDTGQGIQPEYFETIFEPFVQGDRSLTRTAEGTGLGLAISRQLAHTMGGDILVESKVDKGSTFTLVLPLQKEAQRS